MKIRKKDKIIIKHNKKLFYIIIILFFILLFLIYLIIKIDYKEKYNYCKSDSDCFKDNCCHANSCINRYKKPNCGNISCSQECINLLDCNYANCICIKNKCQVKINK